jgi:hypothetical protein
MGTARQLWHADLLESIAAAFVFDADRALTQQPKK